MASRTIVISAVLLSTLFGIGMCAPLLVFRRSGWDEATDAPSPGPQHIAHGVTQYCDGPLANMLSANHFIEISRSGTDRKLRIFESSYGRPEMQWTDDGQLRVDIRNPQTITLSLHDADGFRSHITYQSYR
jgi:hypothetical protein